MRQKCLIKRPLTEIACPSCGAMLPPRPGRIVSADHWLSCLRRCDRCRIGVSNAMNNPTTIFDDPRLNVPEEVKDGVLDVLALTLNVRNRENKRVKFGFSTSEDNLTWTLFKFLNDSGQLTRVLRGAGLPIQEGVSRHEALLLWGVPIPLDRESSPVGWGIRRDLEEISNRLGEDPTSRTEPDVLIDFGCTGFSLSRSSIEAARASRMWGTLGGIDTTPLVALLPMPHLCVRLSATNWLGIGVSDSN